MMFAYLLVGIRVIDANHQFAALHLSFDQRLERLLSSSAADDLRPWALLRRRLIGVPMYVPARRSCTRFAVSVGPHSSAHSFCHTA